MRYTDKAPRRTQVSMFLGRASGGSEERSWRLTIEDRPSGCVILEVEFDNETFADLMSHTHSGRVGEAKVYSGDYVGLTHEHKVVTVPVSPTRGYSREEGAAALAAMAKVAEDQNPGWVADKETTWNHHRVSDGGKLYSITLRRWVEPSAKTPAEETPAAKRKK